MVTRQQVLPYMNQRVIVHTRDGAVHDGILHAADGNGIYLRRPGTNVRMANASRESMSAALLNELPQETEATEAWWPFFFLPWLAIAAFSPWYWWW